MNKTVSLIVTLGLVVAVGIIFLTGDTDLRQSVEIKDGIQYITVSAKGGYSPRITEARAGIPTKLIVQTDGTYDCSASLVIRSLGFQKILARTGEEIIDIGIPEKGQPLQGICGMGMYSFVINFT